MAIWLRDFVLQIRARILQRFNYCVSCLENIALGVMLNLFQYKKYINKKWGHRNLSKFTTPHTNSSPQHVFVIYLSFMAALCRLIKTQITWTKTQERLIWPSYNYKWPSWFVTWLYGSRIKHSNDLFSSFVHQKTN